MIELQCVNTERALLGALIIDPDAVDRVASIVTPDDFSDERHAAIYNAMLEMRKAGVGIDLLTLSSHLARENSIYGGSAYLAELINAVPSAVNAASYAKQIADFALRRRVLKAASQAAKAAFDLDDEGFYERAMAALQQARGQVNTGLLDAGQAAISALDFIEMINTTDFFIRSGITPFDARFGGFPRGEVSIVAARPGRGKTSLLLHVLRSVAENDKSVLFVSLEMSTAQLIYRLARQAGAPPVLGVGDKLNAEAYAKLYNSVAELERLPVAFAHGNYTSEQITTMARTEAAKRGKLDMVIVDYIQLIKTLNRDRRVELEEAGRVLKQLAVELNCAVVAAAQMNRAAEIGGREPEMADLREAGFEADAAMVTFLHVNGQIPDNLSENQALPLRLIVRKHRHGPLGSVEVLWIPARFMFTDKTQGGLYGRGRA